MGTATFPGPASATARRPCWPSTSRKKTASVVGCLGVWASRITVRSSLSLRIVDARSCSSFVASPSDSAFKAYTTSAITSRSTGPRSPLLSTSGIPASAPHCSFLQQSVPGNK
eukprot:scaffold494_cov245-Pinguiococcus_pyrenoidosus.AAC.16